MFESILLTACLSFPPDPPDPYLISEQHAEAYGHTVRNINFQFHILRTNNSLLHLGYVHSLIETEQMLLALPPSLVRDRYLERINYILTDPDIKLFPRYFPR